MQLNFENVNLKETTFTKKIKDITKEKQAEQLETDPHICVLQEMQQANNTYKEKMLQQFKKNTKFLGSFLDVLKGWKSNSH